MKLSTVTGLIFTLMLLCVPVLAQDPIVPPEGVPVESDWLYRQHYAQVQEIMGLSDIAAREQRLESYHNKLNPKAKISQYMSAFFGEIVKAYQAAGRAGDADALVKKMDKLFPGSSDKMAVAAFQTAYQNKNHAKVIELGEPLYAKTKDAQILVAITDSYIATKNVPKSIEYCNKVISSLGIKKGVNYAYWLAEYYTGQQDLTRAGDYYSQLLKAYPSAAPEGWDAKRWGNVLSSGNTVIATNAYVAKGFDTAIKHFKEALSYSPTNDHAYLFLGLSYWKTQELELAMDAFAKGAVVGGPNSPKCREYLEQLFKPRNNDSLEGLDEFLAAAKAALGV